MAVPRGTLLVVYALFLVPGLPAALASLRHLHQAPDASRLAGSTHVARYWSVHQVQRGLAAGDAADDSADSSAPAALDAGGRPAPAAEAPRDAMSTMQCTGTLSKTRACRFRNLYYDVKEQRFAFFGPQAGRLDEIKRNEKETNPWLQLGRHPWQQDMGHLFKISWEAAAAAPEPSQVVIVDEPVHIRAPFQTRSFGHLVRDNLQALVELPQRFGQDPLDYRWLLWPTSQRHSQEYALRPSAVMEHYAPWVSRKPFAVWQAYLDSALASAGADGVPKRYVRFSDAIAGWGGVDYIHKKPNAVGPWTCPGYRFQALRQVAYGRFGIPHVPAPRQPRKRVLFLAHKDGERRGILNLTAVLAALRARFPALRVDALAMSDMSAEAQMRVLSETAVLVSNVGSASFRLVYLPDGAAAVLVGSVEGEVPMEDGRSYVGRYPFRESDECWSHLGYVSMMQYRVRDLADAELPREGREDLVRESARWQTARIWDASVRVDATRLGDMIEAALDQMAPVA